MQSMVNTAISGSLHSTAGCRQAKMFLHGPDKQLTRFAMGICVSLLVYLLDMQLLTDI